MEQTGSVSIDVAAPAADVFALVADLSRMGEWSPECVRCEWLDGADGPAVGATFQGYNAVGDYTWDIPLEVVEFEPGARFAFRGPIGAPNATTWRYEVEAADGGCRVTESFDAPMLVDPETTSGSIPGRRDMMMDGMQATLNAIKAAAEA